MKQLLIISGKGGTGKTVIAGALAALPKRQVIVDCDVDAANLHILMQPQIKERNDFRCGATAIIDAGRCTQCGLCRELCRFDAVSPDFTIDPVACEGCGLCQMACPSDAIEMKENISGQWFISDTRFGPFVHARLGIAEENSGKLVTLVKGKGQKIAEEQKADWMIIDGSPGIGCPVIASLSGVDCALIVTEPTLSGLHDAQRVFKVARHFGIATTLAVNKYDLSPEMTQKIEKFCQDNDIEVVAKIAFDRHVVDAMVNGKTILEDDDCIVKKEIINMWDKLQKRMLE